MLHQHDRQRECERKAGYWSWERAEQGMERLGKRLRKQGDEHPLNVYLCTFCGLFHIGHVPSRLLR